MSIDDLLSLIPPQYEHYVAVLVACTIALRTFLRGAVHLLRFVDKQLDGRVDWTFVDALDHLLTQVDHWAGWAAVTALLPKPAAKEKP